MWNEAPECVDPWRTVEYVDVATRARELGCAAPEGVALLPGNFATAASRAKFRFHEVVPQVRQAWRGGGLIDTGPGPKRQAVGSAPAEEANQELPITVFFGANLPPAHTRPVLSALSLLAFVLSANPCYSKSREVRVDAVVEHPASRACVCLEYKGDTCELISLVRTVHEIRGDTLDICGAVNEDANA